MAAISDMESGRFTGQGCGRKFDYLRLFDGCLHFAPTKGSMRFFGEVGGGELDIVKTRGNIRISSNPNTDGIFFLRFRNDFGCTYLKGAAP